MNSTEKNLSDELLEILSKHPTRSKKTEAEISEETHKKDTKVAFDDANMKHTRMSIVESKGTILEGNETSKKPPKSGYLKPKEAGKKNRKETPNNNYVTMRIFAIIAMVFICVPITINYTMGHKIIDFSSFYEVKSLFGLDNMTKPIVDHVQMYTPNSNPESITLSRAGLESLLQELKQVEESTHKKIEVLSGLLQNLPTGLDSVFDPLEKKINTLDEKVTVLSAIFDAKVSAISSTLDEKVTDLSATFDAKVSALSSTLDEKVSALISTFDANASDLNQSIFTTTLDSSDRDRNI